jgi:hypothetical protein
MASEKDKKAAEKAAKKQEPITADATDGTPPGSASPNERGTPQRNITEATVAERGERTPMPSTTVVPDKVEPDQIIATVPYRPTSALDEVRQSLVQQIHRENKDNKRSNKKDAISNRALIRLISVFDTDPTLRGELDIILESLEVSEEQIAEAKEAAVKNPKAFAARVDLDTRLHSLGLPPDAAPRPSDDKPSGLASAYEDDKKYWPTRYAVPVDEDNFVEGDLIYQVHEDSTFTVLSIAQQTRSWQSANTLPAMNLISRVGYDDAAEIPEELQEEYA